MIDWGRPFASGVKFGARTSDSGSEGGRPMQPPLRVLYFEDEAMMRRIITRVLEHEGMEVRTANNGVEGLALAREWLPDVILMDLMMPEMDGYDATKALRADPRTQSIVIIAYSALDSVLSSVRAFKAGVDLYFPKFTNHAELIATIRERCTKRAA
jgi:CheY-like chemotaxis protein